MTDWQEFPAVLFGPKGGETLDVGGVEMVRTDDGIHYPIDLLARKAHLFSGVGVYDHHRFFGKEFWREPLRVGHVTHAVWDAKRAEVRGFLMIHSPSVQRWIEGLLISDQSPGLSPMFFNIGRGPKGAWLVKDIRAIESVDFSSEPFSGARVLPASEAIEIMAMVEAKRLGYHLEGETSQPTKKWRGVTVEQMGILALALAEGIAVSQGISRQSRQLGQERKESFSLDQRSRQVRDAWRAKFAKSGPSEPGEESWPKEVFDDAIIVEVPNGLLSYPYTINDDGEVEFDEPKKVEISYQKAAKESEQREAVAMALARGIAALQGIS